MSARRGRRAEERLKTEEGTEEGKTRDGEGGGKEGIFRSEKDTFRAKI